jgi:hypothetical protein
MPTDVAAALIAVPAALLAAAVYLKICAHWPYLPCRTCNGTAKRPNLFGQGFRLCGTCDATGRRVRLGRRLYERLTSASRLER